MPKDPWGSDYIYRDPGLKNPGGYDLYPAGPERQADTSDDDWGNNQHLRRWFSQGAAGPRLT